MHKIQVNKIHKQLKVDIKEEKKTDSTYKCSYCKLEFEKGCQLGGHISKVHKGISKKYKDRILIRQSRTNERDRLKYLKQILNPL